MQSKSEKRYQTVISVILVLVSLCMILPIVLLFTSSITEESVLLNYGYSFLPRKVSFYAYEYISRNAGTIIRGYLISIIVTVIGTVGSLLLTSMIAYPLSVRKLPFRNAISFYVLFTMLFSGGLVPSYIMWTQTFHINNTIWAYILPNMLLSAFNVILMRTFFQTSIPEELYEAARIDGSGYFRIYVQLVLPLSKPILGTIGLFTALAYWNDWMNGQYYVTDQNMRSIQTFLNYMIQNIQALAQNNVSVNAMSIPTVSIRMAVAFIAILPILLIYPVMNKFLVSGIMVGAVKG